MKRAVYVLGFSVMSQIAFKCKTEEKNQFLMGGSGAVIRFMFYFQISFRKFTLFQKKSGLTRGQKNQLEMSIMENAGKKSSKQRPVQSSDTDLKLAGRGD